MLAALELSVESLPDKERGAFLDCAVFPEDVAIPEATLEVLWSRRFSDPLDADDAAQLLVERSLLRRDEERRYRLHDLYHDYLRASAENPPALHGELVEGLSRALSGRVAQRAG